ncbi:MAG: AI-2E family transporter [Pseudomonadota bacterium]
MAASTSNSPRPARISGALRLLVTMAVGLLLYVGQAAFIPVALSFLLSLILATPVEALYKRGLPRSISAALILVVFLGLFGETVELLWNPAQTWWASAPQTIRTIEKKVRPVTLLVNRVSALTHRATEMTAQAPTTPAAGASTAPTPAPASVAVPSITGGTSAVLHQTRDALVAIITVVILTLFLLAGGPPMVAKMGAALVSDLQAPYVLKLIDASRSEVGRYYSSVGMINVGLGLATALVMWVLGMPTPYLWGLVAGLLNFIPYVGSTVTLLLLTVTAFVTFNNVGQIAAVAGSYLALATIEGQIAQPLIVGRRLRLNPVIVFLALWFGGWFWGIPGIVMAVPGLVILKVVAEHSRNGKPLQEFLGPNDGADARAAQVRAALTRKKRAK